MSKLHIAEIIRPCCNTFYAVFVFGIRRPPHPSRLGNHMKNPKDNDCTEKLWLPLNLYNDIRLPCIRVPLNAIEQIHTGYIEKVFPHKKNCCRYPACKNAPIARTQCCSNRQACTMSRFWQLQSWHSDTFTPAIPRCLQARATLTSYRTHAVSNEGSAAVLRTSIYIYIYIYTSLLSA